MKLFYQINLAFGILLAVVLTVIGVTFHYVLQNHLVTTQEQNIGQLNVTVSALHGVSLSNGTPELVPATGPATVAVPTTTTVSQHVSSIGTSSPYLVSKRVIPYGMVTLRMPMQVIRSTEHTLLEPLLVVLCIGGLVALLMSVVITRRLVRPLMQLRNELHKVEHHKFSEVQLIRTSGEIGDVALTVYRMANELENYNRVQKQFTQNASHELKTPLMSIAGYAEGIRDHVFRGAQARKGLDVIIKESKRLERIVTEMTFLAQLDGGDGEFRRAPVTIQDMVSETVERIYPLLSQKGVTVETEFIGAQAKQLVIEADRDKLLQAFINVVANAVRYANSKILIQVKADKVWGIVSISDDGEGIPEQVLPHVFHRFVRGKNGETGLGLAISRAIVERCGGRIAASNRTEGGADVTMSFPMLA